MIGTHQQAWLSGLAHEKEFWRGWFAREEYAFYLQPRELAPEIAALIPEPTPSTTILELGAGAISLLGNRVNGVPIQIVQLDPLTDWYQTLLAQHGVRCPYEAFSVRGEDCPLVLGDRKFDLVVATNSLDHCEIPDLVLHNLSLVRKGPIYLRHYHRCAEINGYLGLHQWNMEMDTLEYHTHRMIMKSKLREFDVAEAAHTEDFQVRIFQDEVGYEIIEWIGR